MREHQPRIEQAELIERALRIEEGEAPYNLILELKKPSEHHYSASKYIIKKSPYRSSEGSCEFTEEYFRAANDVWRKVVEENNDDLSIIKAWARDVEAITNSSRKQYKDLVRISGFSDAVDLYLKKSKISTKSFPENYMWKVTPENGESGHPLNKIVHILEEMNIGVVLRDDQFAAGLFSPSNNTIFISTNMMLQENSEGLLGTIYHEIIHAVFHNLSSPAEALIPYEAKQTNRQGDWNDPYKKFLHFSEIQAHAASALFESFAEVPPKENSSSKLMESIVKDRVFTQHILSQYDFKKTIFDNGNWGECSARVELQKLFNPLINEYKTSVLLKLSGNTTFVLPESLSSGANTMVGDGQSVSLIDFHQKQKELANKILEDVKRQIAEQKNAAAATKLLLEKFLNRKKESPFTTPEQMHLAIDESIKDLIALPGIREINDKIPNLIKLLKDYYMQLLGE